MSAHLWRVVLVVLVVLLALPATGRAASFTVTDSGDPGDGTCDVTCTLRDAILAANATVGTADDIGFSGPMTIHPASDLPAIGDAGVTIDGTLGTPGARAITLDGAGAVSFGLFFDGGASTVRGVAIGNFSSRGVATNSGGTVTLVGDAVGTDASGQTAAPNAEGVYLNTSGNVVRDSVISGNASSGVVIDAGTGDVVAGNRIGVAADGVTALPNGVGIMANGSATGVRIGGALASDANVISGNANVGVYLQAAGTTDWTIQGNLVGLDASGTVAVPNVTGVLLQGADGNTVADNVVSGNNGVGILLSQGADGADGNVLRGNRVGTDRSGVSSLGNASDGIAVEASSNTTVGPGNVIADNGAAGVRISTLNAVDGDGNRITQSALFGNGGLGIDLAGDGVTPNDPLDADSGPNELQNHPAITSAVAGGGATDVSGTLDAAPSTAYHVELYAAAACDPSGYGEADAYLGATEVTTDAAGHAAFAAETAGDAAGVVTATATAPGGATSELSGCAAVTGRPPAPSPTGGGTGTAPAPAVAPQPELGTSVVVAPAGGTVLVRVPGARSDTVLTAGMRIPVGSAVDTTHGTVALTSAADTRGATQTASFWAGRFIVRQARSSAITDLVLARPSCAAPARRATAARKKKRSAKRLWGHGKGHFRTDGQYGTATVTGTYWLTENRCDGTLVRVKAGTVAVRDLRRRRTVAVHAGHSYLARR